MVSNSSSIGEDVSQLSRSLSGTATEVGQSLGLAEDDLIPGDPTAAEEIASHLSKLGGAFDRAGEGFKKIDTGGWHGKAADAARGYLESAPAKWLKAADCFAAAGEAVADYQRVLTESQAKAARAKADLDRAQQASQAARESHNARVDSYNTAAQQASDSGGPPPAPPGQFRDPAADDITAAQHAIDEAKAAVQAAGDRAARAVLAAAEGAPPEPGLLTQLKENLVDRGEAGLRTLGSVGEGLVGSLVGLGKLARMVSPFDPYRITHPSQSNENMATLAMGVVSAVQNPYATLKTTVDVDGWRNDPAKTLGACIPDAIASVAGGAGAASRIARGAGKIAERAGELGGRTARHADHLGQPHQPWAWRQQGPTRAQHSDPPGRPSDPDPLASRGDHDVNEPRDPTGPEAPNHDRPDTPGNDPGSEFEAAQRHVAEHGDPIRFGEHPWEHLRAGADDLPEGLSRQSPNIYPDEDPGFLHRNLDPADNPLYRKIQEKDLEGGLEDIFQGGVSARHPDAPANLGTLGAHMGASGSPTPFISTTDNLGHALARDGGFKDGVVLDIRDPGGHAIDADATFKNVEGDQFISHGEGEKLYVEQIPREHIRGGWALVDGKPRWFDNPYFDRSIMNRSAS